MATAAALAVLAAAGAPAATARHGSSAATLAGADVSQGQALAMVRQVIARGWACATPGSGLSIVGYRATRDGSGWTVTATASGVDRWGQRVTFPVPFRVSDPTEVRAPAKLQEEVIECAGPLDAEEAAGPVVRAFTEKGAFRPGQSVALDFSLRDNSGKATVHLNLYEGGEWKARRTGVYKTDGTTKRYSLELDLAPSLVGPLSFCVWAENARKERSKNEPRSSCGRMALEVDIRKVSNGCGGKGWDVVVKVENYFGNTGSFHDATTGKTYVVDFSPACDLHDAGYGGQTVRDALHGNRLVDFQKLTRKEVDEKFKKDMALLCDRTITDIGANAARAACKENFRYRFVRDFGNHFFDANLMKEGTQKEGARSNA